MAITKRPDIYTFLGLYQEVKEKRQGDAAELEFDTTPPPIEGMTDEEIALEYLELEESIAAIVKRMDELKKAAKRRDSVELGRNEYDNGTYINYTESAFEHFDAKGFRTEFLEARPRLYKQFVEPHLEDRVRKTITFGRVKATKNK